MRRNELSFLHAVLTECDNALSAKTNFLKITIIVREQ